jgi:molybdate transport system substrate-binding protein
MPLPYGRGSERLSEPRASASGFENPSPAQNAFPGRDREGARWAGVLTCVTVALATIACSREPAVHTTLAVAAAANLTAALQAAGPKFEAATGIHPAFSFASTAQLAQQIENAAPFDVFLAADAAHAGELEQRHLLAPGTRAVYAVGVLALWLPPGSPAAVSRIEDLVSPSVRTIAMAKPELAPYGEAAVESLKAAGVWPQVEGKIVYAENIAMARQYGSSGNTDATFTAYSLVLHDPGKIIQVDEKLHQPIAQELGILASSQHQAEARKFTAFFLSGGGRDILREYGYNFAKP